MICSQRSHGRGSDQRQAGEAGQKREKGPSGLKVSSSFRSHLGGEALPQNGIQMSGFYVEDSGVFYCGVVSVGMSYSGSQMMLEECFLCNRLLCLGPPSVGLEPWLLCLLLACLCTASVSCQGHLCGCLEPARSSWGVQASSGAWSRHALCRQAGFFLLF